MSTLFSEIEESGKKVNLFIYCDEVKQGINSLGERWMYLGILIVPENKKEHALQKLMNARKETDYFDELHFTKLSN